MSGACWRCRFFVRDDDEDDEGGFCRRYPPAVVADDDEVMSIIPGVEALDWCGEFEEMEDGRER